MRARLKGSIDEQEEDRSGLSIIEILQHSNPKPSDYIWIDYPVVESDSLWGIIRRHWNLPKDSGHDREVKELVALTRKYNNKSENWRPDKGEIIKIPTIKLKDLSSYSWNGGSVIHRDVQRTVSSSTKEGGELPSNFAYYSLSQEEVDLISMNSTLKVLMQEYNEFRRNKHLAFGSLKFFGGILAITGGIICIIGSGGLAIPLVIGTASTTLGVTTTGLGAAELILTAKDLNAADEVGAYKNAGHAIGKSLDKALGTEFLARAGNFTNIMVNFGSGARLGVTGEYQAGAFRELWSAFVGGIANGADFLEQELKDTALYRISKNPELLDDPVIVQQAMIEVSENRDHPIIKAALGHLERKIVEEVEYQKLLVRRDKYLNDNDR